MGYESLTLMSHRVRPRLKRASLLREILETVLLVASIYTLFNLATARFVVEGPSMQPTFQTGQFLLVSRVNYMFSNPTYGDIIVFHYPNQPRDDYIKRVIGIPGDVIEFRGTELYVNGRAMQEPYINEPCQSLRCRDERWELEANEFFVMGDNRNQSSDSRSFGPVSRQFIVGEAVIRYWPPHVWGIVHRLRYGG